MPSTTIGRYSPRSGRIPRLVESEFSGSRCPLAKQRPITHLRVAWTDPDAADMTGRGHLFESAAEVGRHWQRARAAKRAAFPAVYSDLDAAMRLAPVDGIIHYVVGR